MQGYNNTLFIKKKCIHHQCLIFRIIIVLSCVKIFKSYYLIRLLMLTVVLVFCCFLMHQTEHFAFRTLHLKKKDISLLKTVLLKYL